MSLWLLFAMASWPLPDAQLSLVALPRAPAPKKIRVVVDAGHGAPGNEGNSGCHCQREQDHTLSVADALAQELEETGRFVTKRTRTGAAQPSYAARIATASAWKADVIISLHSDARGEAEPRVEKDGRTCFHNPDDPGFAVLWNDEGLALKGRERLGRALGSRLREAGFLPYDGNDYGALYRPDDVEPSGWIDIRPLRKRVYFLRASKIPTVIIETHHALDDREVARWSEPATVRAFSRAVAAAILDATQSKQ